MADSRYTTLTGWLRAKPPLAGVRIDGDDKRIVRVVARQFATAEEAIAALDPSTIEGLDAHGAVIRVWKCKDAASAAERSSALAQRETWPEGETAQLGQVITAACDRAAGRHENAYRYAFDTLQALYKEQSERMTRLENLMIEGQRNQMAQLEAELEVLRAENEALVAKAQAQEPPSTADGLMNTVLAAGVQKMLTPGGKPSAPNGAQ